MNSQNLKNFVWGSYVFSNPQRLYNFDSENTLFDTESASKVRRKVARGDYVPKDQLPSKMYCGTKRAPKKLPNVFIGAGYCIVKKEIAEILENFELGLTHLHPVGLYEHDQLTQIEGEYFYLIIAEKKESFQPELSPMIKRHPYVDGWVPSPAAIEDAIVLNSKALESFDIWTEKSIWNVFFMSDALYKCLVLEGLADSFDLVRCPIISETESP